ncbi:hypothetical protein [Gordonia sp. OPL2]|uniref:hypothetical protein n=1 Tax=Gordonia sp. OPL2 TaxID=2486274 RepID=UPI0021CD0516|nr:hypothetical protein [Gordonia sp. OPL2]
MSVARFVADQRTKYRAPHAVTCRLLEISQAWFYKWRKRAQSLVPQRVLHTTRN